MGLDISAYQGLKLVKAGGYDEDLEGEAIFLYPYPDPEGRFAKRAEPFVEGMYSYLDEFGFRAGSYSGYNMWRTWLCRFARGMEADAFWKLPEPEKAGPFAELIDFADNEGLLGTPICAKLYEDFKAQKSKIIAASRKGLENYSDANFFRGRYDDWMKAFKFASKDGAVQLH